MKSEEMRQKVGHLYLAPRDCEMIEFLHGIGDYPDLAGCGDCGCTPAV